MEKISIMNYFLCTNGLICSSETWPIASTAYLHMLKMLHINELYYAIQTNPTLKFWTVFCFRKWKIQTVWRPHLAMCTFPGLYLVTIQIRRRTLPLMVMLWWIYHHCLDQCNSLLSSTSTNLFSFYFFSFHCLTTSFIFNRTITMHFSANKKLLGKVWYINDLAKAFDKWGYRLFMPFCPRL